MTDIEKIREQIDKIDDEIVRAYIKRMELCASVAAYKKENNQPISAVERERKILYRITENVPEEFRYYLKELYGTVFATSKAYQTGIVGAPSKTADAIRAILKEGLKDMPTRSSVACQGMNGANSGAAANKLFPICDITYFKTFEGVFSAVESGLCEYGVLPIENSTAGSVSEVYDLMKKYNFHIVRAVRLKIEHCLAGVKGATIKGVKKVISHPQALRQCAGYIKAHKFEEETAENTATAAKRLCVSNDASVAVLCSPECAQIYGLQILDRAVQDDGNNFTRFICIGKEAEIFKGSDKISIMTALSHKPGSLNDMLGKFSSFGLNLTKIESRPIVGTDFEFMFYFDFEGNVTDEKVVDLIGELENNSDKFVFLGNYKETL